MEIEELEEFFSELSEKIQPTDGVVVMVVGFNTPIDIRILQMGLMNAAHIERQIPQIFQAIQNRRGEIAREEQKNAARTED